ncbi:MAG: hypothetical protein K6T75_01235 [Acetobacteraceae bacterium]|nr:hypothetical protein [Acetobacteraceae bacterium]
MEPSLSPAARGLPPFRPRLLATGVGSLPHRDPEDAVALSFSAFPEIPHWPQLPALSRDEGFSLQYLAPLLRLGLLDVVEGKSACFDVGQPNWLEKCTAFYQSYLEAQSAEPGEGGRAAEAQALFAFPRRAAAGFYAFLERLRWDGPGEARWLKGQVSGPLTVGFQVTDPGLRAAFYDPQLRDLLVRALEGHARWQARALGAFGLPVIIFVDEPGLYAYGQSTFVGLNRGDIAPALEAVFSALESEGAVPGAHVCARCDWSILFESRARVVDFDAYSYFASLLPYVEALRAFLDRGGVLGWGIVPASEQAWTEDAGSLAARFEEGAEALARGGVDPARLLEQSLISPSCGTGTLSVPLAERICRLARELSLTLRERHFPALAGPGAGPEA